MDSAGFMDLAFSNPRGPLTLGGTGATSSVNGSGGQGCQGKVKGPGLVEPCRWQLTSDKWHMTHKIFFSSYKAILKGEASTGVLTCLCVCMCVIIYIIYRLLRWYFLKLSILWMLKEKNLAENWKHLVQNLKKVESCRTHRTHFLQLWDHPVFLLESGIIGQHNETGSAIRSPIYAKEPHTRDTESLNMCK